MGQDFSVVSSNVYMQWTEQPKGNLNVVNQIVAQPTMQNQEKVYTAASKQLLIIKYISTIQ